jgi:hypothetical protein
MRGGISFISRRNNLKEERMTKHTPGPWKIGRGRQDAKDPVFWHVDVLNTGGTIRVARVAGVGRDAAEANARLISSAPELLDALSFLVQAAETEPGMAIYRAHIEKGKAAIAKAEGRE